MGRLNDLIILAFVRDLDKSNRPLPAENVPHPLPNKKKTKKKKTTTNKHKKKFKKKS